MLMFQKIYKPTLDDKLVLRFVEYETLSMHTSLLIVTYGLFPVRLHALGFRGQIPTLGTYFVSAFWHGFYPGKAEFKDALGIK